MDYNLDIVVSEKDLSKVGINEIKFFWGGAEHSHTPRRFETEDSIVLISFYSEENIINGIDTPIILTSVKDVYDLQYTAYSGRDKLNSHNLMKFLKRVSELEKFNIYLCGCDELIDYNIKYTGESDISEIIYRAFVYGKSVMIYK